MILVATVCAVLMNASSNSPTELYDYLKAPDSSFSSLKEGGGEPEKWHMVSQTWHGHVWKHVLEVVRPQHPVGSQRVGVLIVTGGVENDIDLRVSSQLADLTGLPVANIFDIPNQPIDDLIEDGLIAHTFQKYLDTGDATWPLLFPMTKSVLRAMDVLERDAGISEFVVTGESKRGWTTWMVGASGDKRVIGICPMVIDNLNIAKQLKHQLESWNAFSPMLSDYTGSGLMSELGSDRGKHLIQMVDPWWYRSNIHAPVLIVNGANDPYWTSDALSQYWGDLHDQKWASIIPNAGHNLGNGQDAIANLAAFARACSGQARMPSVTWHLHKGSLEIRAKPIPMGCRLWMAESSTLDFHASKWEDKAIYGTDGRFEAELVQGASNRAYFAQVEYGEGKTAYTLTTPIQIVKPRR